MKFIERRGKEISVNLPPREKREAREVLVNLPPRAEREAKVLGEPTTSSKARGLRGFGKSLRGFGQLTAPSEARG